MNEIKYKFVMDQLDNVDMQLQKLNHGDPNPRNCTWQAIDSLREVLLTITHSLHESEGKKNEKTKKNNAR
jgi:hypothetical protein